MSKRRQTITSFLNDLCSRVLTNKFQLLATSAFTWDGLPDGMQERHIESLLYSKGMAGFFRDPVQSYMCLEAASCNMVNAYGDPTRYRVTGVCYSRELPVSDIVIIENNNLRIATADIVDFYVYKMAEVERTMDVNVKAVKTPIIFACDDRDVLTFKRIFQQVDGNVPAIFADKGLNLDSINAFKTDAKFLGNELQDYKKSIENELLTFLGLNNLPTDKKERLITDEANSNNQLIQSYIDMQLDARKRCADAINDRFGLSISVGKRTVEKPVENPGKAVENNAPGAV